VIVPDPMLRYGVTLILAEDGQALRGVVAVYAADVLLHELRLDPGDLAGMHAQGAVQWALDQAGEWLVAKAGERAPTPEPRAPTPDELDGQGVLEEAPKARRAPRTQPPRRRTTQGAPQNVAGASGVSRSRRR
jgi:hypothetical protein